MFISEYAGMADCELDLLKQIPIENIAEENQSQEGIKRTKKRPYKRKLLKGQTTLTSLVKKIKMWKLFSEIKEWKSWNFFFRKWKLWCHYKAPLLTIFFAK